MIPSICFFDDAIPMLFLVESPRPSCAGVVVTLVVVVNLEHFVRRAG
jgi:hypothetical protein